MTQQEREQHARLAKALEEAGAARIAAVRALQRYAEACEEAAAQCRASNETQAADAWTGRALAVRHARIG
jgi:hypothetical protein